MLTKTISVGLFLLSLVSLTSAFHASVKGDGFYCVMFEGNVTGTVHYEKEDNTTASFDFAVDESSINTSGECIHLHQNTSAESISFSFLPANSTEAQQWNLTVHFHSEKDNSFEIADVSLVVVFRPELNSSVATQTYNLKDAGDKWFVGDGEGYACSSSKFELDQATNVVFHNLRVLAFAQLKEDKFPIGQLYRECALDTKTSELVPIIVGICLAGLVIVVLIAYLIGRARARRQGYASV